MHFDGIPTPPSLGHGTGGGEEGEGEALGGGEAPSRASLTVTVSAFDQPAEIPVLTVVGDRFLAEPLSVMTRPNCQYI